jgi:hypothetical protein
MEKSGADSRGTARPTITRQPSPWAAQDGHSRQRALSPGFQCLMIAVTVQYPTRTYATRVIAGRA